jgi:uncharacterized protein (UPF0332 family)
MNFEDCLNKKLIIEDKKSINKINDTLKKAELFINDAKYTLKGERFSASVILGYNAFFSLNQALLFNKGFNEKSHVCLSTAVKELYKDSKDLQSILKSADELRLTRHKVQYTGYDADASIADFVVELVEDYFGLVKELLKC